MIMYDISEEELNQQALELLAETDITNMKPGSRARAILKVVCRMLRTYYRTLDFNLTMAFVDKATGSFLDSIGLLLNCHREPGESDDNYRYRITHQVYVVEGANRTAIRLRALSVDKVADVYLTPWTFGTGSFTVHVITNNLADLDETVAKVQEELDECEAFGVKGLAMPPKILPVTMKLAITFSGTSQTSVRPTTIADISRAVRAYIDGLGMGEELVLSKINQIVHNVRQQDIVDVALTNMTVKGRPVLISNYKPYWDEKLYVAAASDIQVV